MSGDMTEPVDQNSTDSPSDSPPPSNDADSALQSILAERDRYLELARRTQAEFENYQKRVRRDVETERRYASVPVLTDLLPVLDNLERALQSAPADDSTRSFVDGIKLLHKQWLDVLDKHGVTKVPTDGQPFDVNFHEAIMQQPSPEHPPMTVLHTVRTGYQLHDRVLRPAQVIVSATPASS
jgi:molecular chaperone GrpE